MKRPKRVLLVGIDGAVPGLVEKHIAEGICPNFKKIFEGGVKSLNSLCPMPTITPPNWTTISTGAWPVTHQITDYWRHIPGTSPNAANTEMNFSGERIKAETIFEAAERAGKKSIVVNYPTSYGIHKRLKNSIVVGGSGLSVGTIQDNETSKNLGAPYAGGQIFCDDLIVGSAYHPGGIVSDFSPAKDWENVHELGDDPMEIEFDLPFEKSPFKPQKHTWYWLIRDVEGDGYDTVTLSPSRNFDDAFFTLKLGEWSDRVFANIRLEDGSVKEVAFLGKILKLNDDGTDFDFYLTQMLNTDGDLWCFPNKAAASLRDIEAVPTTKAGFLLRMMGWYDDEMFSELIEMHNKWLGEALVSLMDNNEWDLCFFHTHPTDSVYHYMMTELDPDTCSSKEAHEHAWEFHRRLYRSTDAMLGKLIDYVGEDTAIILVSDHGSKADGAPFSPVNALMDAGLLVADDTKEPNEAIKLAMKNLSKEMAEAMRKSAAEPVIEKCKAFPQRACYVYVNLKGRDPNGIVEPEDYHKVQREIIDALYTYVDPKTGIRPVALALSKEDALVIGMGGEQCGDVVYSLYPEFGMQHGAFLATAKWGIGDLHTMGVFYGPGFKKGFEMERVTQLADIVPTICYMMGLPYPKTCEGAVLYQALEEPDSYTC
ncbi:type I phosphodiesterase/nucleotide pyrophosphatase [Pseudodesulfovibrio mercurii]|uniref:Type I phosphodiesterase/nucleotide pyrophosphatase n=1 Tax=Pseudodesulfovibrio mercurii TaxID=641491 RepID=F0JIC1_9BACT|nr:alkaline phosphatase family protein [Pseudodesulfovibrio mercurii]EGB14173.1 type I phosphodiesterase/nucleotide pyrophosphatase [Pseudodesulfovibrio mercurii]